jgi:rod shape-determining protein MreD
MSSFAPYEFAGWLLRLVLAQGVILLFLLLTLVSFSMPHAGDFKPFFLLMAVYYWAIYRPTVMPVAYTFILGLVVDIMAGLNLGLTALLLIGAQIIVQRSRLFLMGQPFVMVWLGFAILCFSYAVALWLLISIASWEFAPLGALVQTLIAGGLSILLFPLASVILQAVHRLLPVHSSNSIRTVR